MDKILYSRYNGKQARKSASKGKKLSVSAAAGAVLHFPFAKFFKWGSVLFISALLIGGAAYSYSALSSSESFMLKKISVTGNKYVSKNEILALAKLEPGKNLFKVSAREAEERVRQNMQFKKVSANKIFPETLEITVVERQPVAYIGEEQKLQVDGDRVMFPTMKSQQIGKKLYVLTGLKVNPNDFGRRSESIEMIQALDMAALLNARKLPYLSAVVRIDIPSAEELCLMTDGGRQVYRIGAGNWDEKLDRLEQLLRSLSERREKIEYVDLRFRDEAAVMFRK